MRTIIMVQNTQTQTMTNNNIYIYIQQKYFKMKKIFYVYYYNNIYILMVTLFYINC